MRRRSKGPKGLRITLTKIVTSYMSISREQLARIEDLAPVLLTISEKEIKADVKNS